MFITLIAITLLLHALLTICSLVVWNKVLKDRPQALPRLFFLTTIVRLLASVALFLVALMMIRHDTAQVKMFTLIFIAAYLLLLIFDTAYFCHSSKTIENPNHKQSS